MEANTSMKEALNSTLRVLGLQQEALVELTRLSRLALSRLEQEGAESADIYQRVAREIIELEPARKVRYDAEVEAGPAAQEATEMWQSWDRIRQYAHGDVPFEDLYKIDRRLVRILGKEAVRYMSPEREPSFREEFVQAWQDPNAAEAAKRPVIEGYWEPGWFWAIASNRPIYGHGEDEDDEAKMVVSWEVVTPHDPAEVEVSTFTVPKAALLRIVPNALPRPAGDRQ